MSELGVIERLERPDNSAVLYGDAFIPVAIFDLQTYFELFWPEIGCSIEGPQAATINGRLPVGSLASIPSGRLEHSAAARWNAMRAYIGKRHGVWIRPLGPNSSYRAYAAQLYFWNLYRSGRGNTAAYPGTSNHGWGRAVDVATPAMAYYIRKYGHLFGWSHAEGARVGEWWHFTYVGGVVKKKPARDPLWYLTKTERRWVKEYVALKRSGKNPARRRELWHALSSQRKMIWRAAMGKTKGEPKGWSIRHRRARYNYLSKLTGH